MVARTLLDGHAAGPVQHLLVADEIAAGSLVRILPDWKVRSTELYLAYPSVRFMRPAVRALSDAILENLRGVEGLSKA